MNACKNCNPFSKSIFFKALLLAHITILYNNQPTTTDVATIYCHSKTTNIVDSKMARYCSFYIVDALNPCKINMIGVA